MTTLNELPDELLPSALYEKSKTASVREGRLVIDPPLAQRFLDECSFPRQKRHKGQGSGPWIETYAEMMRKGMWRIQDPIAFARLPDGRLYIVNGHHRLMAVVESFSRVEFRISVNDVGSAEDLDHLYYSYDTNVRRRTAEQILDVTDPKEAEGLSKLERLAVYNACATIINGMKPPIGSTMTRDNAAQLRIVDVRMEIAEEWWPIGRKLHEAFDGGDHKIIYRILRNAGTYAVAMVTMKYRPQEAFAFWRGVARDDGLARDDPRKTLIRDLDNRPLRGQLNDARIRAASVAWNAFYRGQSLKIIRFFANGKLRILGTPIGADD